MILLFGIPSETALAMVAAALTDRGAGFLMVNQRNVMENRIRLRIDNSGATGELFTVGARIPLDAVSATYLRPMDDQRLPEVVNTGPWAVARQRARAFHEVLVQWTEVTHALVINRYSSMGSNFSKPYQAQLIARAGFEIPDTLVANDPAAVLAFREKHRDLVFKSISSERSIVKLLTDDDLDRLERIRHCPVQFQQYVEGEDLRVHTVGQEVFATSIRSAGADYRYAASRNGAPPILAATEVPDDVADRCLRLAASLELEFAGIDLRRDESGRYYCFEINPSPGFSYYESHTGQPIAKAVAAHLIGRRAAPVPRVKVGLACSVPAR